MSFRLNSFLIERMFVILCKAVSLITLIANYSFPEFCVIFFQNGLPSKTISQSNIEVPVRGSKPKTLYKIFIKNVIYAT